jgi:glutaredoxin 3
LALLQKKAVTFREIEAPQGSQARAESIRRSGGRTSVPQIFIDGTSVGGSDELRALDSSGELDRLLRGSGATG